MNCTVNVQDMCQKEVMEQSAGKSPQLSLSQPGPLWLREPLNYRKGD